MRLLCTYLWKEWRDHRTVLIGMLVAVPLLLTVMGFALPRTALEDQPGLNGRREDFAAFAAFACFALFVVSLATDLVPGEARRGHRWFLERLPGGLGAAFRGKIVLFALGAAFFAAYGYLAASVTCRVVAGAWPAWPSFSAATWIFAVVALWAFAVSCSLPRGALSLPATAALALLLGLPLIVLVKLYPYLDPSRGWLRWESAALWSTGAIVAAWASFRRSGFLRAGRACLVVGAVCAMPYWADAARDAYRMSLAGEARVLWKGFVGEGGRYAFLNRYSAGPGNNFAPLPPVILDLETGVAREVGSPPYGRFGHACRSGVWWTTAGMPQRYVALSHDTFLDARTADVAYPSEADLRAAARETSPWRFGADRRAWFYQQRLEADAADGGFEVLKGFDSVAGLGLYERAQGYHDFGRGRSYTRKGGLVLRGEGVWIRPGPWLTYKKEFRLFDPDSNTFREAKGLEPKDRPRIVADDGRVLLVRAGRVVLVDPESGETTEARTRELADVVEIENAASRFGWPTRVPGGRRVVRLSLRRDSVLDATFARCDGDDLSTTAVLKGHFVTLLGCPDDDTAIVVADERAIWRLRFGSDAFEEVWRVSP
jgi:hypothetical protein